MKIDTGVEIIKRLEDDGHWRGTHERILPEDVIAHAKYNELCYKIKKYID